MGVPNEDGQAAPLGAMVLGLGVAVTLGLAGLAADMVDVARARTAADAAALAGVTGGEGAAARMAAANGGELVGWSTEPAVDGLVVSVEVRVNDAVGVAAATGG